MLVPAVKAKMVAAELAKQHQPVSAKRYPCNKYDAKDIYSSLMTNPSVLATLN